jgi:hypothetical protein
MENWLKSFQQKTSNNFIRIIITIIIVLFTIAGFISLVSDLGFGEEIAQYRWQIWLGLVILSIFLVLIYKYGESLSIISGLNNTIEINMSQLEDSKVQQESLLRLMEKYKRAAYTEVLEHLNLLLILTAKRGEWQTSQARITKIKVKPYSVAENIDLEFAKKERIDIIINIGQKAGVCEGMEFWVRDPQIPLDYGVISVSKVHENGSICTLLEQLDPSFWEKFYEVTDKNTPRILDAPDNLIVPNLPPSFDTITPENADSLQTIISKIIISRQKE